MPNTIVERGFTRGLLGFFTGAACVFWGLRRLIGEPKLRSLAAVPLVLTAVVYALMGTGIVMLTPRVLARFRPEDWLVYLWWIVVVVVVVGLLALGAILFTAIVELIGGPFYDKMAAHQLGEHGISVQDPGFVAGAVPDLVRGLLLAVPAAVCWGIGLIPVIGVPFWVLGVVLAWFGLGSAAMNPSLLMTGHEAIPRTKWFLRYLPTTLGMGAVIALSMFIPFLGLVTIPSGVIGAAQLYATTANRDPL